MECVVVKWMCSLLPSAGGQTSTSSDLKDSDSSDTGSSLHFSIFDCSKLKAEH